MPQNHMPANYMPPGMPVDAQLAYSYVQQQRGGQHMPQSGLQQHASYQS
jgi:pheromone receptor transcription factor